MLEAKDLITIKACENLAIDLDSDELNKLFNIWVATKEQLVQKTTGYLFVPDHYDDPSYYEATNHRPRYVLHHLISTRFDTVSQNVHPLMNNQSTNIYQDLLLLVNLIRCARLNKVAETKSLTDTAEKLDAYFRDIFEDTVKFAPYDMKFIKKHYPTLATAMPKLLLTATAETLTNVAKIYDEKKQTQATSNYFFSVPVTLFRSFYQKHITGTSSDLTWQHIHGLQASLDNLLNPLFENHDNLTLAEVNNVLVKALAMIYCAGIFLAKEKPLLTKLNPISTTVLDNAAERLVRLLYRFNPEFPVPINGLEDDMTRAAKMLIINLHQKELTDLFPFKNDYYHHLTFVKSHFLGMNFNRYPRRCDYTNSGQPMIEDDYEKLCEQLFEPNYRQQTHASIYQRRHP